MDKRLNKHLQIPTVKTIHAVRLHVQEISTLHTIIRQELHDKGH